MDQVNKKVVGFYTIFVGNVKIQNAKKEEVGIQKHRTVKEIPCIKVLYFGISDPYKGKKVNVLKFSQYLMFHLKFRCGEIGMKCGVCIVHLDSHPGAEKFYTDEEFFKLGRSGTSSYNSFVYLIDECIDLVKNFRRSLQPRNVQQVTKEVAATSEKTNSKD